MIQRDSIHAQPAYTVPKRRNIKRRKEYGTETPQSTKFEEGCLTIAAICVIGVMLISTYMAFPDYVDRQLDHGRAVVASSLGLNQ